MAFQSRSQTKPSAGAYDVRVLAFPAASGRTVQGLMQLFGIDQASAQRLIASVPVILSQQASANDAEACAQALRRLGARVHVEPSATTTAAQPLWSEPSPLEEDILPRPVAVPAQNDTDLEFDMLSSHEADPSVAATPSPGLRDPLDMELSLVQPNIMPEDSAPRGRGRQAELDLQTQFDPMAAPALELDAVSAREPHHAGRLVAEPPRARVEAREPTGPQPIARPQLPDGQPPMSRAAVVSHLAVESADRSRTVPLLQLCFGLGVMAGGYWLDASILFGSASVWGVLAHGLALYQLVLAVRGLVP